MLEPVHSMLVLVRDKQVLEQHKCGMLVLEQHTCCNRHSLELEQSKCCMLVLEQHMSYIRHSLVCGRVCCIRRSLVLELM